MRPPWNGGSGGTFASGAAVSLTPDVDLLVNGMGATGSIVLTLTPRGGGAAYSRTLLGGCQTVVRGDVVALVAPNGSKAAFEYEYGPAGAFEAVASYAVSGTQAVRGDVTAKGSLGAALLQHSDDALAIHVIDPFQNILPQGFSNGTAAGATGLAYALVTSTAALTLDDGTSTKPLSPGALSVWTLVTFPVVAGKTYTIAGTGLAILGGIILIRA